MFMADGSRFHSFYAEIGAAGLKQGAPRFQVALHAGDGRDDMNITESPLTDRQAIELWDSLLGSLRVR